MKVLVIKKNNKEVGRFTPTKKSSLIGRSPICDLVIRKDEIKPMHFLVEWVGEGAFDPYSGLWTVTDISSNLSSKESAFSGEAQVLMDSPVYIHDFEFLFIEEKLAASALSKGVLSRSLDVENSNVAKLNTSDNVLELVTYSLENDYVTAVNHFNKDILSKGIKIASLPKINFNYSLGNTNEITLENQGETNLVDIYNRTDRLIESFGKNDSKVNISTDDFFLLYSPDSAYYLRWVPKVEVTPPPIAWKKDPVVLTLAFVTVAMFIIGMLMKSIERPKQVEVPKPSRVATVQVLETKENKIEEPAAMPVIEQDQVKQNQKPPPNPVQTKELAKKETIESKDDLAKKQKSNKVDGSKNNKVALDQGKRATVKNTQENDDLSQGLNQKAPIKNVNQVGLLGKLGGAKKMGSGVSAQAVLSKAKANDSATGSEGRILVAQPPTGKVNLTGGKTESDDGAGAGLSAASTTLKMDNLSKGSNISGMASSKATGSVGMGAFGGNTKAGSDSIETLGGAVALETKAMEVQGGLTKDQVRQAISDNKRALRNCHEQYLTYKKDLGGRLVLKWKINGEGPVDSANIQSTNTSYPNFDTCVLDIIKKIVFPKAPNGNATLVIYPFVFQPKK